MKGAVNVLIKVIIVLARMPLQSKVTNTKWGLMLENAQFIYTVYDFLLERLLMHDLSMNLYPTF